MTKREEALFVSAFVYNRTKNMVRCYNSEGNFVELMSVGEKSLPAYEQGIYYIVTEEEYERIRLSGRTTCDLVHVIEQEFPSRGRADMEIVYLEEYDTPKHSTKPRRIIPCSASSYDRRDPCEKIHKVLDI